MWDILAGGAVNTLFGGLFGSKKKDYTGAVEKNLGYLKDPDQNLYLQRIQQQGVNAAKTAELQSNYMMSRSGMGGTSFGAQVGANSAQDARNQYNNMYSQMAQNNQNTYAQAMNSAMGKQINSNAAVDSSNSLLYQNLFMGKNSPGGNVASWMRGQGGGLSSAANRPTDLMSYTMESNAPDFFGQ